MLFKQLIYLIFIVNYSTNSKVNLVCVGRYSVVGQKIEFCWATQTRVFFVLCSLPACKIHHCPENKRLTMSNSAENHHIRFHS